MTTRKTAEEIKETTVEEAQQEETPIDPGEELVQVQLFKDNDRYKDDLFVAVNGERILIQRGVPVPIKRKFAEVIENSQRQDHQTDALMQRLSEQYEQATREKTRME
ncbi:MAG: hypothetical protein IKS31_01360 [Clostridia bacterium]|nr:hypothetical protein [Clostridia bacterium]